MNYYGMTIGPVEDTISCTSKPAGLWMASYFFSSITRDLCSKFSESSNVTIVSPHFSKKDAEKNDGIGRYNDRIILQVEEPEDFPFEQKLKSIIDEVKKAKGREIAACLPDEKEDEVIGYIENYIYVRYICLLADDIKDNNVLASVSDKLDGLEQMPPVPVQGDKPYLQIVLDENDLIKKYCAFEGASGFLTYDGHIKDLPHIASFGYGDKSLKYKQYFAVVYADGDHMGSVVKELGKDDLKASIEAQQEFSKKCLKYTADSAKLIEEYGGLPIYAGGDDLLFLAPLVGKRKETVFDLCSSISRQFNTVFIAEREKLKDNGPSLSFGISINYHKFPLYEAVDDSRRLLFAEAKGAFDGKRIYNSIALRLQKASGQSEEMVLGETGRVFESLNSLLKGKFIGVDKSINTSAENRTAHSAIFTIENIGPLIEQLWAPEQEQINDNNRKKIFKNFFDNSHQEGTDEWIGEMIELGDAVKEDFISGHLRLSGKFGRARKEQITFGMSQILRICKFFVEKKGDEE